MCRALLLFAVAGALAADGPGVLESRRAPGDPALTADPDSPFWRDAPRAIAANDRMGSPVPGHRTEIRSRWTGQNLYFLFICPYEELHLKPNPVIDTETNQLWNWDVAEVFIGNDFENIRRYKEFEMSPRGEWVDLDIDREKPQADGGWKWNSGWTVRARLDEKKKIWYGEMRIPFSSIDDRPIKPGLEYRLNLYRCQGSGPSRKYIAWQPVNSMSFHTPQAFGKLRLAD